jgi:hypothetical protein
MAQLSDDSGRAACWNDLALPNYDTKRFDSKDLPTLHDEHSSRQEVFPTHAAFTARFDLFASKGG